MNDLLNDYKQNGNPNVLEEQISMYRDSFNAYFTKLVDEKKFDDSELLINIYKNRKCISSFDSI